MLPGAERVRASAALSSLVAVAALAACGGATPPAPGPGGATHPAATRAERKRADLARSPLPRATVTDVGRGGSVQLASLAPRDRPLLVWAWAPL